MNEEPLNLVPREWRSRVFAEISPPEKGYQIPDGTELCPACRFVFKELMQQYNGDFQQVHVVGDVHPVLRDPESPSGVIRIIERAVGSPPVSGGVSKWMPSACMSWR